METGSMNPLTQRLRDLSPPPLRRALGPALAYSRRLKLWADILRHMRGVTEADRRALRIGAFKAPLRALSEPRAWQNPEVDEDVSVVVKGVGRFTLRARSDDLYLVLPTRERAIHRVVVEFLRPGDIFVDAGANIGFHTIAAAKRVGPTGKVIAIEMMPDTAAILRRHVAMNGLGNVEIIEAALATEAGQRVTAHVREGHYGTASVVRGKGDRAVTVETTTLDAILAEIPRIRLMKMDLEGAEDSALAGGRQVLGKVEACILEEKAAEPDPFPVLREEGFRLHRLDGANVMAVR